MSRSFLLVAMAASLIPGVVASQQSLTPPGMPPLRAVQERPVEAPQDEDAREESTVREESGSLSFGPPQPAARGGSPATTLTPPVVTTRPVNPGQEMPPLNIRAAPAERPEGRMAGTPAEGARSAPSPVSTPAPQRRAAHSNPDRAAETDEIARLEAEVAAARARLPAGPASVGAAASGGQIPPAELSVKPGVPVVFNIARQHLNRIITPYASPFVKTTTEGTTATVEGRIVYVASNNPGPVSLFIGDDSDPVNAIAVTVVPRDIPAVQVTLKVEGYEPSVARPVNPVDAERFELSQPFLQTIRELFRALALGEVPSGYGMSPIRGAHPMMPDCPMTGLQIRPMQEVAGSQMLVLVAKARNVGGVPVSLNEEMCASDHVVAVAAWPRRELLPGQATEVFIALRRPVERPSKVRPSVLMGN